MALKKRLQIIGTVLRSRSDQEKAEITGNFTRDVLPLFANGSLSPRVDKVFEIESIREAHEYVELNKNFGKVVIRM